MSELTIIQNANDVTQIIIGKGYSYFLTPTFNGIDNEKLKTIFYAKMQLVCNFLTTIPIPEIKLTASSNTKEYAVKVEKRRATWANVVKIGENNIVLIYISDKYSDGKNTGKYTLYSTHKGYDKKEHEEMVTMPGATSKTNINALVSNETLVLFNKLQILEDPDTPKMEAFAGHVSGGGGGLPFSNERDNQGKYNGCCNKSYADCRCSQFAGGGAKKEENLDKKKERTKEIPKEENPEVEDTISKPRKIDLQFNISNQ